MSGPCLLHLSNGWTVSISSGDTPPAICSVAAWPTEDDDRPFRSKRLFEFGRGAIDQRCWTIGEVRDALNAIVFAPNTQAQGAQQ